MAVPLRILLILTLITGIHSIKTVRQVSVKAGAPVTIPCLYEAKYRNNVKYLCKGSAWLSCSYEIKTNKPQNSKKYSIYDDKTQTIFTVTIKELADRNTYYWCIVEIDGGDDVGERFYLSGTTGSPSLYVDNQTVTGFIGENITINCHYTTSGERKWCKLNSNCVTGTSGSIDGTRITLNMSISNVFSVTLSELRPESRGWYYCVKGDFQMPVHLTVTEKPTSTLQTSTNNKSDATAVDEQRSSVDINSLIIPLSLLILVVIVALFAWFILKCKQAKADSPSSKSTEEAVTYSDVAFKTKKPAQTVETDVHVTYSSVATAKQQSLRRSEAKDMDVTYAAVIHHKRNAEPSV